MAQNAIQDANQFPSAIYARGTAGTADIKGTAGVVAGAANPATGAQYVETLGAALPGFNISGYDSITAAYPDGTTETYTYKSGTTTLNTLTVVYTDSTKGSISTVTKT